jgi:magnesium chelatase subunit D
MTAVVRSPVLSADSALAAALFAVDPAGLGGVVLRCGPGSGRDEWLALLKRLLPAQTPWRRVPLNIQDAALLGGIDLAATLQSGSPVAQQGVLVQADGGVVLLAMAERQSQGLAARLAGVLDTREVVLERDGLTSRRSATLGVVALDEGIGEDEQMPLALRDRMAFRLELQSAASGDEAVDWQPEDILRARALLPEVSVSEAVLQALCAAALALGVDSLRAPLLALRAARAAAALAGLDEADEDHAAMAARLVLAHRATQMPQAQAGDDSDDEEASDEPPSPQEPPPEPPQQDPPGTQADPPPDAADESDAPEPPDAPDELDPATQKALEDAVLDAAVAALPPGLLAALKISEANSARAQSAGRAGAARKSQARGRPIGARRGEPRAGSRLNIIETLRAAAPWQRLRRQQVQLHAQAQAEAQLESQTKSASITGSTAVATPSRAAPHATAVIPSAASDTRQRIHVRREDFHVWRFRQLGQTTTLFVVDASGSSALHRLAEAKGAVELLLADCYVRRDRVAVIAFRGKGAEILLPPTRSLARAKRSLAGLPGGGGTPLATAIDAAAEMASRIARSGETPVIVLLTDGRANVARDGKPGRERANEDALASARQLRVAGVASLLLDTSPQAQPAAQLLAQAMGATYVPLPYAGAQSVSQVVRMASAPQSR